MLVEFLGCFQDCMVGLVNLGQSLDQKRNGMPTGFLSEFLKDRSYNFLRSLLSCKAGPFKITAFQNAASMLDITLPLFHPVLMPRCHSGRLRFVHDAPWWISSRSCGCVKNLRLTPDQERWAVGDACCGCDRNVFGLASLRRT